MIISEDYDKNITKIDNHSRIWQPPQAKFKQFKVRQLPKKVTKLIKRLSNKRQGHVPNHWRYSKKEPKAQRLSPNGCTAAQNQTNK